ncbi:fluoride efflux transporter CrcB [Aeromicrobium chenweiae]|uniref:Fluoride-specific ion channel FluC n=1 Tax=Aeromicrobium chenweiae TaxID=2079793 RepID=A0A2S0WLZ4_9ACTN|nr:fluoride efflux transporter CrcB [Aeromicrobium chenweiae]AWB92331.1 fluoride efflux transporter CrcB [Aeromicrobium chenweiae]TGN31383.1 fluoride efflux transporter CrcB [Aeromicrobium chenweiae]
MSPLDFVLLTVMGGVGASLRYTVDAYLRARITHGFQWTTTIINASGSFVLGFLTGLTTVDLVSSNASIVIGTGLLGGYTTFSTASYETVQLIEKRRYGQAFVSGIVMLVLCVALAALGLWIGDSM